MSTPHVPAVVVGVDGSAASRAALGWAVRYAESNRSVVQIVAAWHQPASIGELGGASVVAIEEDLEAQAKHWVDEAVEGLPAGALGLATVHVVEGDATSELLAHARDAELLVLGNKHRGPVMGAIVGSVALTCLHRAACPVVLVPDSDAGG